MLIANEIIKNSFFSLRKLNDFFNRVQNGKAKIERPDITFFNLDNAFYDIKTALSEIGSNASTTPAEYYSRTFDKYFNEYLAEKTSGENNLERYQEIINKLEVEFVNFEDYLSRDYYTSWDLKRDFTRIYDTSVHGDKLFKSEEIVDKIFSMIDMPDRKTNTLVVGNDDMSGFVNVHGKYPNNTIYSIHNILDSGQRINGGSYVDRYIYGGLKGAKVTNEAFDIVIITPEILKEYAGSLVQVRKPEHYCLERVFSYAAPGSFVAISLPYFRFYRDVASRIAKTLENVKIFHSFSNNQFAVIVVGQKRANVNELDNDVYGILRNLPIDLENVDNIAFAEEKSYHVADSYNEIKMFRGNVMVEAELDNMFRLTSSTKDFWKDQDIKTLSEEVKKPLLPFNNGQIGIILTSGCLDGVVDEGDDYCHLIKGRIIKMTDSTTEIDEHSHQTVQTSLVSNRVEINAFLPDGTFKRLA